LYKDHRAQYGRDRYRTARSTKAWQGWDCGPFLFFLAQARLYAPLDMIAIFRVELCGCENAIVLGLTTRKRRPSLREPTCCGTDFSTKADGYKCLITNHALVHH